MHDHLTNNDTNMRNAVLVSARSAPVFAFGHVSCRGRYYSQRVNARRRVKPLYCLVAMDEPRIISREDLDASGVEYVTLEHHVVYGQPGGNAPPEPVKASDWEVKPFREPTSAPWDVPLSRSTVNRLLLGFMPQEMEDKWFIYTTAPTTSSSDGTGVLHLIRSWTGTSTIDVTFQVNAGFEDGQDPDETVGRITRLTFENEKENQVFTDLEEAKDTAEGVCKYVLGVELPGTKAEE